jgi:hypothetical protein
MVKLFLHYFSRADAPDSWDIKFAGYLYKILLQVVDPEVVIHSNFNISGIENIHANNIKVSDYNAVVLILQENETIALNEQTIPLPFYNAIDNGQIAQFFLVQKYPHQESVALEKLSSILQYPFYELNYRTLQYIRYNPEIAGVSEDGFWTKISDLAFDIKYLMRRLHLLTGMDETGNIYLAEVSKDQGNNYNKIKRELLLAGFTILPQYLLPRKLEDFKQKVEESLEKSVLSIHILGELYGDSPEDSDYSYSELQNRIYDTHFNQRKAENKSENIQRIIWMPPVLEFPEEKQVQYLKRLRKEQFSKSNTEFVQSSIADLVKLIDAKHKRLTSDAFEFITEKESHTSLLIVTDSEPNVYEEIFTDLSMKYNFLFEILSYRNAGLDSIHSLMNKFKYIDSFIIINAGTGELWLKSLIYHIIRSKGYADAMQISSIGVFSNIKVNANKQFMTQEIQEYSMNAENFKDQLELHISNLKS